MRTDVGAIRRLFTLAGLALFSAAMPAVAKTWLTATVVNAGPVSVLTGSESMDAQADGMTSTRKPASVVFIPNNARWEAYVLQANGKTYYCRERRALDSKPAAVSAGAQITFYLRNNLLVFKDKAGKEHKAFLVSNAN